MKFKKITRGLMRLKDGRVVKQGDVFTANDEDVPNAFRDGVEVIDDTEEEIEPKFTVEASSPGWYQVVNDEGKPINDQKLRKEAADELAKSLNE